MEINSKNPDFQSQFTVFEQDVNKDTMQVQIFRNGRLFQEVTLPKVIDPEKASGLLPEVPVEDLLTAPADVDNT